MAGHRPRCDWIVVRQTKRQTTQSDIERGRILVRIRTHGWFSYFHDLSPVGKQRLVLLLKNWQLIDDGFVCLSQIFWILSKFLKCVIFVYKPSDVVSVVSGLFSIMGLFLYDKIWLTFDTASRPPMRIAISSLYNLILSPCNSSFKIRRHYTEQGEWFKSELIRKVENQISNGYTRLLQVQHYLHTAVPLCQRRQLNPRVQWKKWFKVKWYCRYCVSYAPENMFRIKDETYIWQCFSFILKRVI